jgi:hypothetical protein
MEMSNELSDAVESKAEVAGSNVIDAIQTPFCGSLRSKKFFMLDALATEAEQYLDASNHCWCRETQQVIGPDGGRATPNRCGPGRSCYTSALESV